MMKKSFHLLLLLCMPIYCICAQQISTDISSQPQELIQNLVGDNCATVSNISSPINGNINNITSYGTFDRGTSNFPLESGIILSTGNVTKAGNTLLNDNLSDGEINWGTDSDILDILDIDQTLNATSIEFDLISANNFIAFRYLFASDEYQQEYPCNFKDVFAILIKRVGSPDPYTNMALVPETSTEVSTNTIHPNINNFCEAQNEDYFQGYNIGSTNFNGHTTLLTAHSEVIAGETYRIKFVIADHIDERFDSAVFIEAEGFGGSVDLGPDQSICGNDLILDADINNPFASYTWFLNGTPINGETNPTLQVNQSGTYNVEVSIPNVDGGCIIGDIIELEIIPFQESEPITDISVCDPSPADGIYDFDFPLLKDDEIFAALPSTNYTISYHLTEDDAINNTNVIEGNYQNTELEETIFVRIESLSGDCLQIGHFNLLVNSAPNTLALDVELCNNNIVNLIYENLGGQDFHLANFEFYRTVTYYLNETDAINQENQIYDYPSFDNEPEYIVARVKDDITGCYSLERINFIYSIPLEIELERVVVDACLDPNYYQAVGPVPDTYDNLAITYNLGENVYDKVLELYPEAISVAPLILILPDPNFITVSQTLFDFPLAIYFEDNSCPTLVTVELHKNLLFNTIGDEMSFEACDDPSNDGYVDFDLELISTELKNGYDIEIEFYETIEDRGNGNNLNENLPYTAEHMQRLYGTSYYNDCLHFFEISFVIHPALNLLPTSIDYCGHVNPNNGSTSVVLQPLEEEILTNANLIGDVEFYLSADDAENQNNEILESYDVINNQQLFYTRITNLLTGCYDISTLELNITSSLQTSNPDPLIVCGNQNLLATVNLESVLDGLITSTDNINYTFHESFDDAVDEFYQFFSISNPSNYQTSSREVFIRAQVESQNCYIILNFEVVIYAEPQINEPLSFINCEANPSDISSFIFETQDENIVNGQENMQVLYFETEDDAINRENTINKSVAYQNTSNPQTIYVRLENEFENSCYQVVPMQIEVLQAPIYVAPTDMFECQPEPNSFATVDLNSKLSEITFGSPTDLNISFHLTSLEAETNSNALSLEYSAITSPQSIFTRIENSSSGCVVIENFSINTLLLPEVNYGQSLIDCADNFDTNIEWDLTEIELSILDGRQYNTSFIYYNSEEDAENDNNPIQNPEAFSNLNNLTTIYAKVTNATTNCSIVVPFGLLINFPPTINDFQAFNICDTDDDTIDLLEVNQAIVENTFNILVSYHTNVIDAETNQNPLANNYVYTSDLETIVARVEFSTTGCYVVYPFQLIVHPLPIANSPNTLIVCDDNFDEILELDLSIQNEDILNGQNPDDHFISYFNTEDDARENNNALDTNYFASNNETVFARVENNVTGCFDITQFSVVINPLPIVDIQDQVLCLNDLPLIVSADTGNPLDTYSWSTSALSSEIEITEIGIYSVTITNEFGCESTSTFNVSESESAVIDVVETIDFSDPNNITVTVNGIGDYLYQLNDLPVQNSNVFVNVPIGYNTITIIDQNGCARITREVLVIDAPKHMTPNGDGQFDTWHITGVETLPGTTIQIFNRQGKLLTEIRHNTPGWDGTYNGNNMPADDYWYVADVTQNGKRFKVTGHFALRR